MQTKDHAKRQVFTPCEDAKLKLLVQQFGNNSWTLIANYMENRTPRQCRERYNGYLQPRITNPPWTKEEDELLIKKYKEYGRKWMKISKHFEGRSNSNVKNRWKSLLMFNPIVQQLDKMESGDSSSPSMPLNSNETEIEQQIVPEQPKKQPTETHVSNSNAMTISNLTHQTDSPQQSIKSQPKHVVLVKTSDKSGPSVIQHVKSDLKLPVITISPNLFNPTMFWNANQTEQDANLTVKSESNPMVNVKFYKNYGGKIW